VADREVALPKGVAGVGGGELFADRQRFPVGGDPLLAPPGGATNAFPILSWLIERSH
jgi:hypothetical protein